MLVDNMPGAAGLVAANYVYKASRPDGLSVGTFVGGLFLQQMLGRNELVDACPVEKEANWITEIDQPLSTHFNS